MDRKELLKRWMLGYIEPSLFYVPWNKNKEYGEYVTIRFEISYSIYTELRRDPVFAIYKVDDIEYKNPIYCTALYDKDYNMIRNGIINRQYFNICSEYGSISNQVILKSGQYKIKMLCSGSGLASNGKDEWEFTIEKGTSGNPIFQSDSFEYSYRDIVINPFMGVKYLGLNFEIGEVISVNASECIDENIIKTITIPDNCPIYCSLSGKISNSNSDRHSSFYIDISSGDELDGVSSTCGNNEYYKGYITFDEYLYNYKTGEYNKSKSRGKKEIVNNKILDGFNGHDSIMYWNGEGCDYKLNNSNTLTALTRFIKPQEFKYCFSISGNTDVYYSKFETDIYSSNIKVKGDNHLPISNSYHYEEADIYPLQNSITWSEYKYNENTGENELIKEYTDTCIYLDIYGKYSYLTTNRYKEYGYFCPQNNTSSYSFAKEKSDSFKKEYVDSLNIIKEKYSSHEVFIPFTTLISSETIIPPKTDNIFYYWNPTILGYNDSKTAFFIYNYNKSKNDAQKHIVQTDTFSYAIDMGVDWSGYDNHEDPTCWIQNSDLGYKLGIYSSEIEVYHPELIPQESGGET